MRAYAFLGEALRAYQGAVVDVLRARGFDLEPLEEGALADLPAIAAGPPALLFLCGLPFVRTHDAGLPFQPLAAPVAAAAPDDPPGYRSVLLARPGLAGTSLADLHGARLAINGRDSMSGWVLPVGMGLPLERFAEIAPTGAHVRSMDLLLREEADAAPIDSMLLA
ncbi:MAG: PhnD/SsuA/transferrin family substrate-binding protein, partial [Gaiellales bacterium]